MNSSETRRKGHCDRWFVRHPLLAYCCLIFSVIVLIMSGLELAYRTHRYYRDGLLVLTRLGYHPLTTLDPELGWTLRRNEKITKTLKDFVGNRYTLDYSTDDLGFRLRTGKNGILFVGDSFTQECETSDKNTYYYEVQRQLPDIPVSAIGVIGYGTLQEILLLDRVFSEVTPRIVVFQMCSNDLSDNCYQLLQRYNSGGGSVPRPYWENGKCVWHDRGQDEWLMYICRTTGLTVIGRFACNFYSLWYPINGYYFEFTDGETKQLLNKSVEVTRELLERERKKRPGVKFFAFNLGFDEKTDDLLEKAALSAGLVWLGQLATEVYRIHGDRSLSATSHFNNLGNRMLGELIINNLEGHLEQRDYKVDR